MDNWPKITFGITCFNAANTIKSAIEGVQKQDWPNFEILIVDDASSDRSVEYIQEFVKRDPHIKLISHEKNRGYPAALNTIVKNASGEFIAIFDDDDVSQSNRVMEQWRRIIAYEAQIKADLVFCYTNRTVKKEGDDQPGAMMQAIGRKPLEPHGSAVADFIFWHAEIPGYTWGQFGSCTLMVRRNTLLKIGGFDESFRRCAEWDLAIRLAFIGGHFIAVDQPLVMQRITHSPDKSGRVPLKYALQLRRKHKSYLKKKRVYWASQAIARSRFYYAKQKTFSSRFFFAFACICAPHLVLPNELAKRKRLRKANRKLIVNLLFYP